MHQNSPLGANKAESSKLTSEASRGSEVLEGKKEKVKLDKSNILMFGPTGSGVLATEFTFLPSPSLPYNVFPSLSR